MHEDLPPPSNLTDYFLAFVLALGLVYLFLTNVPAPDISGGPNMADLIGADKPKGE